MQQAVTGLRSKLGPGPVEVVCVPQFGLEGDLERALGGPVQVVALNRAPPDLVHRVLRDGRLILDRDPAARIRFEVRSRNEFFDLAPIRRLYRRYPAAPTSVGKVAEPRR